MKYHPFYCEENIWHICGEHRTGWALIISNERGAVFFEGQRPQSEGLIWDYHVVYLSADGDLIDFDHLESLRTPLAVWLERSFANTPEALAPQFLVVPAQEYWSGFSSDRSHMMKDGIWLALPPPWPRIGHGNSLSTFLSVDSTWLTAAELTRWAGGPA